MMGHTQKATINARRPMTANMRQVLSRLVRGGPRRHSDLSQSDANAMRALCDRGFATFHIETRSYSATDAGRDQEPAA